MADQQNFSTDYWDEKPTQTRIKPKENQQEPRAALPTYTSYEAEKKNSTLKFWILLVFVATALVVLILITNILFKKDNKESGIVTIGFNFTSGLTDGLFLRDQIVARDFLSNVNSFINEAKSAVAPEASKAVSIAESIASKIPDVANKVKSAVAVATHLPKNVSLGTQNFCVGFANDINCQRLPLNLSALLPKKVEDLPDPIKNGIQDQVNLLQPFVTALTNVAHIKLSLILGLVFMLLLAMVFITSMLYRRTVKVLSRQFRFLVHVTLGVICCFPLLAAVVILIMLRKATNSFPSWVEVKHGEVGGLCIGALCCAIVLTVISAILPTLIR